MIDVKMTECFLGRAVTLSDGECEITVTLDVGPRIIGFNLKNGFNIMYEDIADSVNKDCSCFYGEGARWHIYGGHRLWLSPEDITTYYPDCEKVEFKLIPNGIVLTPPAWRKVDIQPSLKIEFLQDKQIKITHEAKNLGERRKLCLWALTVMKSGGKMTLPLSEEDTGLLANRNLVMWPYASFADKRFCLTDGKVELTSSENIEPPFKFGAYKRDLTASYELSKGEETVIFSKTVKGTDGAEYPDYCCNFESYCTNLIHEIETLSPVKTVGCGESITHEEYWSLVKQY